ncbi:MAG TPA: carboxypeptidase-like regulatory domain-containing protein [Bacillota bacterium]|nr:carboxypeptidase-like regulatory domain-containing protein [Bacillota bacterium]
MMKRITYLLIGLVIGLALCSGFTLANDPQPDVEIKVIGPDITEVEPGKLITLSLLVINHSGTRYNFLEQLALPTDWQSILPAASFTLEPVSQQVRLFTVVLPGNCLAGDYQINYSIHSPETRGNSYKSAVNVKVVSVAGVKSLVEFQPPVVVAGEKFTLKMRYLNTGNSPLTLSFNVKTLPAYGLELFPSEFDLPPNNSQTLTINLQTDSKLSMNIKQIINIKAIDKNTSFIYCDDTVMVDIIPRISGMFDLYHRIPGQLKIITGFESLNSGKLNSDLQIDFFGSGSIDDAGKNKIELHLVTPNLVGQPLSQSQEYVQLIYSYDFLRSSLGNYDFILSPLTRRWSDDYKVNVDLNYQNSTLGAIWPENKPADPQQNELGIYYRYQWSPDGFLKANAFNWSADGAANRIFSIQSGLKPAPDTSLNLEYGVGVSENSTGDASGAGAQAYRINIYKQSLHSLNYSLETLYAAPTFLGYYSDMTSTNGSVSFPVNDKIQSSIGFHMYQNNLDLDPNKNSAYHDLSYQINLSYVLNPEALLVFTLENLNKQNRLPLTGYSIEEKLLKSGLQYQFSQFRLTPSLTIGTYRDLLNAKTDSVFLLGSIFLNYTPNLNQQYSLFANLGDSNYTVTPEANNLIGASASMQFKNNLNLNFEYQKNYLFSENTPSCDCLTFNLTYNVNPYYCRVNSSRSSSLEGDDLNESILATYTFPVQIPISKRTDLGTLKGRVYNAEDPQNPGIANVILRINDISVVTNQNGEFCFESLAPGVYSISMDEALIGLNLAPMVRLPLVTEVKKGETQNINIGMARSGRVTGKIVILSAGQAQELNNLLVASDQVFSIQTDNGQVSADLNAGDLKEQQFLTNVVVELTDGYETFRQVTDENGQFSFGNLKPGKWSVKVYDNNLPPHYYFENAEFQIDLKPAEDKEILFKAVPQVRPIQIIDEGKI